MRAKLFLTQTDLRDVLTAYILRRTSRKYDPTDDIRTLEEMIKDAYTGKLDCHPNMDDIHKYIQELLLNPDNKDVYYVTA